MDKIIDLNRARASGIICLYTLPTGMALWCECATEDGESYHFPADKTLVITFSPQPNGTTNYLMQKAATTFGHPTRMKLAKVGVIASDCTDEGIARKARSVLSGIVIAPPGARIPPGETEH